MCMYNYTFTVCITTYSLTLQPVAIITYFILLNFPRARFPPPPPPEAISRRSSHSHTHARVYTHCFFGDKNSYSLILAYVCVCLYNC